MRACVARATGEAGSYRGITGSAAGAEVRLLGGRAQDPCAWCPCARAQHVYDAHMDATPEIEEKTKFQLKLDALGDETAARILGCSPRAVKSYRLGDRRPRPKQAIEFARVLGMSLSDVYQ